MAKITMSSFREGSTLSHRLKSLHTYYSGEKHIWDIGCDHGRLGLSFCTYPEIESIHLVDPSESVIKVLKESIKDSYITKPSLFIHHQTGQTLEISDISNCIFIAGMGGTEIELIVRHLMPQLTSDSKIIISPHRKILELRAALRDMNLSLINEKVVLEDNQFYQILVLSPKGEGQKVSLYGEMLWKDETGAKYLDHQLRYFSLHREEASLKYVDWLKKLK